MAETSENPVEQELKKLPTNFFPLTKDQNKVENAFQNNMKSALALLGGNAFKPLSKVPGNEMEKVISELFEEDAKAKKEEVKSDMRVLLTEKVNFDRIIEQEKRKFQAVIIEKKKELNTKFQAVMDKIEGIQKLKEDFLNSLSEEISETEN